MSDKRPLRPRQKKEYAFGTKVVLNDPLAYRPNLCSRNTRHNATHDHTIRATIWHDQHYVTRFTYGDDYGYRDGIDPTVAEPIIKRSFRLLLACGSILKTFNFVNYPGVNERRTRVTLQEIGKEGKVNIVIEIHYVDITTYELTIVTAMIKDDYKIFNGDYSLELHEEGAILRKRENNNLKEIFQF